MTYAVVYSSRTGNTRLLADAIREMIPKDDLLYFGEPSEKALDADRIFTGFWTNRGTCDEFTAEFLSHTAGKELFLFGTAGFGVSADYFEKVLGAVKGILPETASVFGSFMCQGKMPMAVRQKYEKMMEAPDHMPQLPMMIENFDKALSHPDTADLEGLKAEVKKYI